MRKREHSQIFTPSYIVDLILDNIGYVEDNVLEKKIIEPSFGDGMFLTNIIERIIAISKSKGFDIPHIKALILSNVFGIEKDEEVYKKAILKIYNIFAKYDIDDIDMSENLLLGNTLELYHTFKHKFDYVVGNPPYVRPHHIDDVTKQTLSKLKYACGTTDLYIAFYEVGITMLNDTGKLGFITPNSFMTNTSQRTFRNDLINNEWLYKLYNFKSYNVFEKVGTYTCICMINKESHKSVEYHECGSNIGPAININNTYLKKYVIDKPFYFGDKILMDNVYLLCKKTLKSLGTIQYGVSTNCDKIYIGKVYKDSKNTIAYTGKHTDKKTIVYFNGYPVESTLLRRCVKASTFDGVIDNTYIIFPYVYVNTKCSIIREDILKYKYPYMYKYLLQNKNKLLLRDMDNELWYAYARTQGLSTINNKKLTFKHIMKRDDQIVTAFVLDKDVVVYSGLYVTAEQADLLEYKNIIQTKRFKEYCCFVGKNMANDYIAVNGKVVQSFQI